MLRGEMMSIAPVLPSPCSSLPSRSAGKHLSKQSRLKEKIEMDMIYSNSRLSPRGH